MHPFQAEQQKHIFLETEESHSEDLYELWNNPQQGDGFLEDYRTLFLQLEATLSEEMNKDRMDAHEKGERGWTPPPRNYIDEMKIDKE